MASRRSAVNGISTFIVLAGIWLAYTPAAQAGFFATVEIRESFEDNPEGLVADNPNIGSTAGTQTGATAGGDDTGGGGGGRGSGSPLLQRGGLDDNPADPTVGGATGAVQKQGDMVSQVSAEIGYTDKIAVGTSYIVRATAHHSAYSKFVDFNFTTVGVGAGLKQELFETVTGRIIVGGKAKFFQNPLRDSTALAVTASLKEEITSSFWLREFYEFERNRADSALYSYFGNAVGIFAGYDLTRTVFVDAGYSFLRRSYDQPADFVVNTHTVSTDIGVTFAEHWTVTAGYDRDSSNDNITKIPAVNNIISVGLSYSY